jgi:peptidoglycan/xylan/chitin deacetylase (PgdA/CDA1 family)
MIRLSAKILTIILVALAVSTVFAEDKPVNVLCYHRFQPRGAMTEKQKKNGDIYCIDPERFEEHMQFLKDNGYTVIPMKKYLDYLDGKTSIPDRAVVLTIDDGYKSAYEYAYPILKKFGYTATLYLYEVFFPTGGAALSVDEVKEMLSAGFEAGCHSYDHPYMTRRKQNENDRELGDKDYVAWLDKQIIGPKKYLKDILGADIETFAYPYGLYSGIIIPEVQKAGYRAAFSVVPSYNTRETPRYALKRTMLFSNTTTSRLRSILSKKPIRIKAVFPEDGSVSGDRLPELKAVLAEDSGLNTTTIRFKMGNDVLVGTSYDPAAKTATYKYSKEIYKGAHVPSITALGLDGSEHEFAWLFITGKPLDTGIPEAEKNGADRNIKQEAQDGR